MKTIWPGPGRSYRAEKKFPKKTKIHQQWPLGRQARPPGPPPCLAPVASLLAAPGHAVLPVAAPLRTRRRRSIRAALLIAPMAPRRPLLGPHAPRRSSLRLVQAHHASSPVAPPARAPRRSSAWSRRTARHCAASASAASSSRCVRAPAPLGNGRRG